MNDELIAQWDWMMKYCKEHGLPPADNEIWREAFKAWKEEHNDRGDGISKAGMR